MQQPRLDLPYGAVPMAPHSDNKTFFGLYLFRSFWQEDIAKITKVRRAPRNVNLARSIAWLVGVTIYCIFFNNNLPLYLASFYAIEYF